MRRSKRHGDHFLTDDLRNMDPIVRFYMLKILVPLECHRELIQDSNYYSDEIAAVFNLPFVIEEGEFDALKARQALVQLFQKEEKLSSGFTFPEPLAQNLDKLAKAVGLNNLEAKLLGFTTLLQNHRLLNETSDMLGHKLSALKLTHVLSVILEEPEKAVREALAPTGLLAKTALLKVNTHYNSDLSGSLDALSRSFADRLLTDNCEGASPIEWLRDMVFKSPAAQLTLDNYAHLKSDLDMLIPYLTESLRNKKAGVNIFIHGRPGCGKTQLTRLIAEKVNCTLYEISCEDEDGDSITGEQRLCTVRAAQAFFTKSDSMLLFDEVEDVFGENGGFFRSVAQTRKAWINHLLEENKNPTFWLCNDIENIDPAFMRRFDWVLEIPVPPKDQRAQIIRDHCGRILDEGTIKQLAKCEELAPAIISRAANVVNSLEGQFDSKQLSTTFQRLVDKTLVAQGHRGLSIGQAEALPDFYHTDFIQCDANLQQLADGIKAHAMARVCLYGIAGSGKTAYARYLAEHLNKPLHIKRGADLLNPYVGGTERNIQNIFREAEAEKAILLIDEVDSFLQDRNKSQHSWETTAVNEMLTCMETYNGVFIASTNRLEELDQASLRRFDLKIKFDPLKPKQAWKLLLNYCQALGLTSPQECLQEELYKMDNLTPGDFALLARQHRFKPMANAKELIHALQAECKLKTPYKSQSIGFV